MLVVQVEGAGLRWLVVGLEVRHQFLIYVDLPVIRGKVAIYVVTGHGFSLVPSLMYILGVRSSYLK